MNAGSGRINTETEEAEYIMNNSAAKEPTLALSGLKRVPIQFLVMAPVSLPVKPQNSGPEPCLAGEFPLPASTRNELTSPRI